MTSRAAALTPIVLCLALTACVEYTTVDLYNNSASEVRITTCRGTIDVPAASTKNLNLTTCFNAPEIKIQDPDYLWTHSGTLAVPTIDQHAALRKQLLPMGKLYFAQLDGDGTIYLVPPSTAFPVKQAGALANAVTIKPAKAERANTSVNPDAPKAARPLP